MITIGIETSGHQGSVALLRDGELLGEADLSRQGRRHACTLVPELQQLLRQSGITPDQIQTLAVSIGPGSFTGLRVGVACARTWAYATGADVVAVDTLLAVACQSAPTTRRLQVISDAQRGELFVGDYECQGENNWARMGNIQIVPSADWVQGLRPDDIVSGPGVGKLQTQLGAVCQLETDARRLPSAATIARLGEQQICAGHADDVWSLEPRYLRKSAAEEKADARQSQ